MVWQKEQLLRELSFWPGIMHEHIFLILGGLPCDETALRQEAMRLSERLDALQTRVKTSTGADLEALIPEILRAVEDLIRFKKTVLERLLQCEMYGLFPLMLDHVIREAEQFVEHLRIGETRHRSHPDYHRLDTSVFWLRIMSEHAGFLNHFFDPSQQSLNRKAYLYEDLFRHLYVEAVQLKGMAYRGKPTFPALTHFLTEVIENTENLRHFKATVYKLMKDCKAFALVPALFAHHVEKEARYFLEEIKQ